MSTTEVVGATFGAALGGLIGGPWGAVAGARLGWKLGRVMDNPDSDAPTTTDDGSGLCGDTEVGNSIFDWGLF